MMKNLVVFIIFSFILSVPFFQINRVIAQSPSPISINSTRSIPDVFIGSSIQVSGNPYISASGVELNYTRKFGGFTPSSLSGSWAFTMKSRLFNPNNTNVRRNDASCNVSRPSEACYFTYDLTQANAKNANGEYLYSHVESWVTASVSMPGYVVWCMPGSSSSIHSANSDWQVAIKDPNNPSSAVEVLTNSQIQNVDGTIVNCTNISRAREALCNLRPEGCDSAPPPTYTPTPSPSTTPTPTPTSSGAATPTPTATPPPARIYPSINEFVTQYSSIRGTVTPTSAEYDFYNDGVINIMDYNKLINILSQ